MPFIPNTDSDRLLMLKKIGVDKFEDLLAPVPPDVRLSQPLQLPEPLSEMELSGEIKSLADKNRLGLTVFAGGGLYDHYIPAALENLLSRPEYVTAYTPYQAEVSQGTLQVIYEFQTHVCRLTGMDAANASMYDGASAAAEGVLLSVNATGRSRVVISDSVSPLFRNVIKTYLTGQNIELITIPHNNGLTDFNRISEAIDDNTAGLLLAQPNFFGLVEDVETGAELIHKVGGKLIMAVDPIAATLLKTPSDCGADIVVGEGQPLGIPLNFGGPLLGFFGVKKDLVRRLPGRLVAKTEDEEGQPGFVLTLQTREQHIRRDKATSNICTNQALCATTATIYMSLMGRVGMRLAALLSLEKAQQAADKIYTLGGFEPCFKGDFIREFCVKTPIPAGELIDGMIDSYNILPGINLGKFYPGMDNVLLMAITEKRTSEEIDNLGKALAEFASNAVLSEL